MVPPRAQCAPPFVKCLPHFMEWRALRRKRQKSRFEGYSLVWSVAACALDAGASDELTMRCPVLTKKELRERADSSRRRRLDPRRSCYRSQQKLAKDVLSSQ
eukprot:1755748-Rhodomonas_salina.1